MKKKKKEINNSVKVPFALVAIVMIASFLLIAFRVIYLANSKVVEGTNLQYFAKQRTSRRETLVARRGTIYDVNGNPIAQNVSSYTLIAYLDPKRTTNPKKPQHVIDKEETAKQLATVLDISEEDLLKQLSRREKNPKVYQTEFGSKAKGLSELKKDEILALGLKGIDFVETQKRYYPYGNFLSYTVGYAKEKTHPDDPSKISLVGEMGLEKYYDKELRGEDGFIEYQRDRSGYKIAGTKERIVKARDGNDIYLTIDVNIQLQIEKAIHKSKIASNWSWTSLVVASAKTGEIIGISSDPSFDPNKRDMKNYLNLTNEVVYEPGSTMKVFTFMAALEKGIYDGNETYQSGVYTTKDGTQIGDWDRNGWGRITFDQGFALSSNTAVINLIKKGITAKELRDYYQSLGFGSKTGIELPNEARGKLQFKYETEILNAGFGQGITTTAIQNVKAMTALTNKGKVLEPYLVKRVVNDEKETIYQAKKKEAEKSVASPETITKMKELLAKSMEGDYRVSTGYPYRMDGYNFIAKTGTAQVAAQAGRGYTTGSVIKSLLGFYPSNDPEIIIYLAIKDPRDRVSGSQVQPLKTIINDIIINSASYLNIKTDREEEKYQQESFLLTSLINKDLESELRKLQDKKVDSIVLGKGKKIISQYPSASSKITSKERVILLTNDQEYTIPDFRNLSHKEALVVCNLLNLNCSINGTGYVNAQSITVGSSIKDMKDLTLDLVQKELENE